MESTTLSTEQLVNGGMKKNNKMTGRREFCCGQLFGVILFCIGVVGGILIGIYAYDGGPSDDVNCKNIPCMMTHKDGSKHSMNKKTTPTTAATTTTTTTATTVHTFNYRINNQLEEPYFNYTAAMEIEEDKKLIYYMEKAVDTISEFTGFKVTYFADLGYYIDSINGQTGNFAANKTYWQIRNGTDVPLLGASSYIPEDGDEVLLNFTVFTENQSK